LLATAVASKVPTTSQLRSVREENEKPYRANIVHDSR
jgi:hypothetical protein